MLEVAAQYIPDPDEADIETLGKDPFLIAYALVGKSQRTVVTNEVSKSTLTGANRKIPDVCKDLDVPCITGFAFFRKVNFRTDWQRIHSCSHDRCQV